MGDAIMQRPTIDDEIITLAPDVTIRSIRPVHSQLLRALHSRTAVRIDCSKVLHCDLGLAQLLVSASRAFGKRQLDFAMDSVPDCIGGAFARAGLPVPPAGDALS